MNRFEGKNSHGKLISCFNYIPSSLTVSIIRMKGEFQLKSAFKMYRRNGGEKLPTFTQQFSGVVLREKLNFSLCISVKNWEVLNGMRVHEFNCF